MATRTTGKTAATRPATRPAAAARPATTKPAAKAATRPGAARTAPAKAAAKPAAAAREADSLAQIATELEDWCGIAPQSWRLADRVAERRGELRMSLPRYTERLLSDPAEREALFELLRVPHSGFFRDPATQTRLGEWLSRRSDTPNVWCAGCSRGEEAYGLAMLVPGARILGTDLSQRAIAQGRAGRFLVDELAAIPPVLRARQLGGLTREADGTMLFPQALRARVQLEVRNLLDPAPRCAGGRWDVIVCRNVLYHMGPAARKRVVARLAGALAPDGVLWVGDRLDAPALERVEPGWYRPKGT